MYKAIITLLLLLLSSSSSAEAAFTDFEDLTVDTEYLAGDSFQSNGIAFNLLGIGGQQGGLLRISEAFGAVDVNRAGKETGTGPVYGNR